MKKYTGLVIPHKGIGDLLFHYEIINSLYHKHKKKLVLFVNSSSKAEKILKRNNIIKKFVILNLRRPKFLYYPYEIFNFYNTIRREDLDKIYYTGKNKWHLIALNLLKKFKKINYFYNKNNKKFIIQSINSFMHSLNIKRKNYSNIELDKKKVKLKIKRPAVFISLKTSENQLIIDNKIVENLLNKLSLKYNSIFINESSFSLSINNKLRKKLFITSNYQMNEINFIISKCKLFIGAESGPAVISRFLKIKSIIFLNKNIKAESKLLNIGNAKYIKNNFKRVFKLI